MLPCDRQQLQDFYTIHAPGCSHLDRQKYTWNCRKTGQSCSPKTCPNKFFVGIFAKPASAGTPTKPTKPELSKDEKALVKPKEVFNPSVLVQKKHGRKKIKKKRARKRPSVTIRREGFTLIRRFCPKNSSKPHAQNNSKVKRVLISYVPKDCADDFRRIGVDVVFSRNNRTPTIFQFENNGIVSNARFCFGRKATDLDAMKLIGSWFQTLSIHDTEAKINLMGSPISYDISFVET